MLKRQKLKRMIGIIFISYWGICLLVFFISGDQLRQTIVETGDMVRVSGDVGHLMDGKVVSQPFSINATSIETITLKGTTYGNQGAGTLTITINDEQGEILVSHSMPVADMPYDNVFTIMFEEPIQIQSRAPLYLNLFADTKEPAAAGTVYYGNSIMLPRGEAKQNLDKNNQAFVDGKPIEGILCFQVSGQRAIWLGQYFWHIAIILGLFLGGYGLRVLFLFDKGVETKCSAIFQHIEKYSFLLEQLVSRDFKTKYKRSILGVLWSFLNPLLTMIVQYIVFSTIFKSDINNFPVYLLSGIICFNFFSEVTSMSLTSIVGNASLITKVYIPKAIYPLSRALSSCINFVLSLIPLLLVMLITKTPVTFPILLLPFAMICLFLLSLGVGLILASLMVFFRDTQFLWNVVSMMWMYMTPIFYPESIITGNFVYIFKLNPLYHIIRFFRIILLQGLSPEPQAFILCLIASIVPLCIGLIFFKKTQDQFVLHI